MTSDDRAFTSPRFCGSSIPTSRLRPRRASEMRGGARRPQIPSAIFWLTYISSFAAPATPPFLLLFLRLIVLFSMRRRVVEVRKRGIQGLLQLLEGSKPVLVRVGGLKLIPEPRLHLRNVLLHSASPELGILRMLFSAHNMVPVSVPGAVAGIEPLGEEVRCANLGFSSPDAFLSSFTSILRKSF